MTFNNPNPARFPPAGGLGVPGAGFASRGKGSGLKRLNLASPPTVGSISENPADQTPQTTAPRTSRSHLLAGLRTAPKTPSAVSTSAPYHKTTHNQQPNYALGNTHFQQNNIANVPHTTIAANFPSQQFSINPGQKYYSLPDQVLAPPSLDLDEQMDPNVLAQLYATELYLSQRQHQLQQMINFHSAQQQLVGMHLNGSIANKTMSSMPQTPVTPQQINLFNQAQLQSIVTQEVPGQPGLYVVYNALTGQSTLAVDPTVQQQVVQPELANSPPPPTPSRINTNFSDHSSYGSGSPVTGSRSISPPKLASSPAPDVAPLPPPSANAFRRGHNRNRSSLVLKQDPNAPTVLDGPKSAFVRPVGMPPTPQTGSFGPGQGRAGEHPVRQPYGPPPLEELQAKPTTKFEGSKNFAARQRRSAINKLVRAGMERRVARPSTGSGQGSVGSMTPVSDSECTFSVPSDNDSDSGHSSGRGSGTLSARLSIGSLRAVANGAIGSERKKSKESLDGLAKGSLVGL